MSEDRAEVHRTPRQMVAHMCNISERQVEALIREGVLPTPPKPGEHDVVEAVRCYTAWREKERSIYTGVELARLLQVGEPQLYKYKNEGMPQVDRGRWDMPACVRWLIQRERDQRHRHSGSMTHEAATELASERLLTAKEDRMLKQLLRQEKERKLVSRQECQEAHAMIAGVVVAGLEAFPGRYAGRVAETNTTLEAQRLLADAVRKIRTELEAALHRLAETMGQPAEVSKPKRRRSKKTGVRRAAR